MIQKLTQKVVVDSVLKHIEQNYGLTPQQEHLRGIKSAIWNSAKGQNKLTYRLSIDAFRNISEIIQDDHNCYWVQDSENLEYKCKICGDYYYGNNIYKELEDQDKPKQKTHSIQECNIALEYYDQRNIEEITSFKPHNNRFDEPQIDHIDLFEIDQSYIELKPITHNITRKKQVITKVNPKKTKNTASSKNQIKVSSAKNAQKDAKFSVENSTTSSDLKPNYEAKELQNLVSEVFETETDSELVDIDDICDHSDIIHIKVENIKACLNCGKEFPLD